MNKEIEKYVWYYLSVYIVVLLIYGFFEYVAVCNGESLKCAFNGMKIKEALTTTASVYTPVIAIFAYFSWKKQKQYDLKKEFLVKCLNDIDEIYSEKLNILMKLEVLKTISNQKAVIYRIEDLTNHYQEYIFLRAFSNIESYNYVSEKKYDLDKIYIFQHYIFFLEHLHENHLLVHYKKYIDKLKESNLHMEFDNDKNRTYIYSDKNILFQAVGAEMAWVKYFFNKDYQYLLRGLNVNQSYDECVENFKTAYLDLKSEITNKLNDI
jgi:hypothetical protein